MSSPPHESPPQPPTVRPSRSRRRAKESARTPFDDDSTWKLFITTHSQIKAWDQSSCDTVFSSSSRGIVAAKRARDGSAVAIADAQVVMLHNYKETQDKTYRLKATQRCRRLQYSRDSRDLFFTDALNNSVQAYHLGKKTVSEATAAHPSPITCFSISCDSNLILSTSAKPPVTYLYNQTHSTTISLAPAASSAAVVCCAFHPTRKSIFVLAFGDGVLAAYDYNSMSKSKAKPETSFSIPRCSAKAIHTFQHLHDPSIKGSAGITGVEFLPGAGSRAITIGEDGRCFLVDFEQRSTVGSWHIGAPATCLAIREVAGGNANRKAELGSYVLAVGTIHGRCIVYDGNGNKIAEKVIQKDGEQVLDVEWVHGSVDIPEHILSPTTSRPASPDAAEAPKDPRKLPKKHSLFSKRNEPGISLPPPLSEATNLLISDEPDLSHSGSGKRKELYEDLENTAEQGYMTLFSPVKRKRTTKPSSLPENNGKAVRGSRARVAAVDQLDRRSVISAPLLWNDKSGEQSITTASESDKTAPNGFYMFNSVNSPENESPESNQSLNSPIVATGSAVSATSKIKEQTDDGKLLNDIRSIRANVENARAVRAEGNTFAAIAPYLPNRIRSMPNRKAETSGVGNRSSVSEPAATKKGNESAPAAVSTSQGSSTMQRSMVNDAAGDERTGDELSWQHSSLKDEHPDGDEDEEEPDIWLVGALPDPPAKPPASATTSSTTKPATIPPPPPPSSTTGLSTTTHQKPTRTTSKSTATSSRTTRSVGLSKSPPQILPPPTPASLSALPSTTTTSSDVLLTAITQMQQTISQQMQEFQEDMTHQLQEQTREILELRQEVGRLWNENIGLRKALEDAGVVEVAGDVAVGGMRRRSSSLRRM
ncbi:WD40 repeat-like protein [Ascodesmis nigricans]|uniref:WD40 repeat-like protein n=1 Tax=Ascodesmis nigricans TaxID=341454 RepID=A0A4S2N2U1_9PEZI|nr:WD40 repeat-like protein [Ascodesmis nigricans]